MARRPGWPPYGPRASSAAAARQVAEAVTANRRRQAQAGRARPGKGHWVRAGAARTWRQLERHPSARRGGRKPGWPTGSTGQPIGFDGGGAWDSVQCGSRVPHLPWPLVSDVRPVPRPRSPGWSRGEPGSPTRAAQEQDADPDGGQGHGRATARASRAQDGAGQPRQGDMGCSQVAPIKQPGEHHQRRQPADRGCADDSPAQTARSDGVGRERRCVARAGRPAPRTRGARRRERREAAPSVRRRAPRRTRSGRPATAARCGRHP